MKRKRDSPLVVTAVGVAAVAGAAILGFVSRDSGPALTPGTTPTPRSVDAPPAAVAEWAPAEPANPATSVTVDLPDPGFRPASMSTVEMLEQRLPRTPPAPDPRNTMGGDSATPIVGLRLLNLPLGASLSNLRLSGATLSKKEGIVEVAGFAENQGPGGCIGPFIELFASDSTNALPGRVQIDLETRRLDSKQRIPFVVGTRYYGNFDLLTAQGFCRIATAGPRKP